MTDRIDRERRGAELLPFYVNGTLSPAERAEVEALLAGDGDLRRQRDLLRQVRAVMKSDEPSYSPGDLGLARAMGAIGPSPGRFFPVAAAVASVGIAVAVVLFQSLSARPPVYEQAGAAASERLILVAFRPTASQGAVSDFLLANGVTIVDGPSAIGLYRVLADGTQPTDDVLARFRAEPSLVESADLAE